MILYGVVIAIWKVVNYEGTICFVYSGCEKGIKVTAPDMIQFSTLTTPL